MKKVGGVRRYLWVMIVFVLLFVATGTLLANYQRAQDYERLTYHARVIADDVWAMNPEGVKSYLRLVMDVHSYQSTQVGNPQGGIFAELNLADPGPLLRFFHSIGLAPIREMQTSIRYQGIDIGTLQGRQYVRLIFSLGQLLAVFLFFLIVVLFILFLIDRRKVLEQLVQERTRSLQESQRRFHDLVNLLPEMVLETDLSGMVLYANSEARSKLGLGQDSHPDVSLFAYFAADDQPAVRKHFQTIEDEGSLYHGKLLDHKQQQFPVLMRSAPLRQGDEIVGARLLLVDMTERQRLEQQLNRDRKMKAIGLMAGGVAHDLNNILSGVVSYPELLLLKLEESDPMHRPLTLIHKAGLQASQVVEDLLTVARGSRGDRQVIDLNELIEEYLESPDFAHLKSQHPQVAYDFIPDESLWNLPCSPIHLRKCLMNLMVNGFEAISSTGEVKIVTMNIGEGALLPNELAALDDVQYIKVSVSDTGGGIDQGEIDRIFEPFYSKKVMGRSGTGLGLTVVWNTVRDHDGLTKVRSSSEGTTFDLYFPATREQVRQEGSQGVVQGNGETILVLDDEARQREIASEMLTTLGYKPLTAATCSEVWEHLGTQQVDLLVLDMILGDDEPSGREMYQDILRKIPSQKAIIVSGYAEDNDVRQTMELGARAFVAKPYTLATLSNGVFAALQERMSR